jgi:hypothetical protein
MIGRDEAETLIAGASSGRYVVGGRTKGGTFALDRERKAHPDGKAFAIIGQWLAAGGDAFKGTLDSRALGNSLGAWLAQSQAWDRAGRGRVGGDDRQRRREPVNDDDDAPPYRMARDIIREKGLA